MKVYAVIDSVPYEGYGLPTAIMSSVETAEHLCQKLNIERGNAQFGPWWDMHVYEINEIKIEGDHNGIQG